MQLFNWIFIKNFQNLKISQHFVFSDETAKNERLGLLISWKYAKIMNCMQFPAEIPWKTSKISQNFVFFIQTSVKLTHGLLNILKNKLK